MLQQEHAVLQQHHPTWLAALGHFLSEMGIGIMDLEWELFLSMEQESRGSSSRARLVQHSLVHGVKVMWKYDSDFFS
jgi:hypothetical protein